MQRCIIKNNPALLLRAQKYTVCLRADEKVTIAGFGRFEMRPRKPKAYTNPKTKVSSRLESTSIPGFKASGRFKQKLESGRAAKSVEETA